MTTEPADSLWQHTALSRMTTEQLRGDHRTDVTVIGAGITGLRAALELSRRGLQVRVLDRFHAGWGASGRSGGQLNPIAHESPDTIRKRLGAQAADRLIQAYIGSAAEVFGLIDEHGLRCDAVRQGWVRGAHCEAAAEALERERTDWQACGLASRALDRDELETLLGTPAYSHGMMIPSAGSVHPLNYTLELARVACEHGVQLHEYSPVEEVASIAGRWRTTTRLGTLDSEWVLHCTNGYTDDALAGLKRTIVPLISVQCATRQLPEEVFAELLPQQTSFADTRRIIHYGRRTAGRRLVFGSIGTADACAPADRRYLARAVPAMFPQLRSEDLEFYWGGRVAVTPDLLPHLHEPHPGQLAGLGYNGRGMAMANVVGRVLAERVGGAEAADLDLPLTALKRIPLHSLRDVGVAVISRYRGLRDRLDVAGDPRP